MPDRPGLVAERDARRALELQLARLVGDARQRAVGALLGLQWAAGLSDGTVDGLLVDLTGPSVAGLAAESPIPGHPQRGGRTIPAMAPRRLTSTELSTALGGRPSARTLRRWAAQGRVPAVRAGGDWLFDAALVEGLAS